jgi:hypothetical protein
MLLVEEKNAHLLLLNRRSRSSVACIHPTEDISWDRINWDRARRIGEYEGSFTQEYRMPAVSFDILLEKLRPKITPDLRISSGKTKRSALLAEHVLAFTLRYLGGASYHELKKVYGMKKTNLYHWIHKCIQAINVTPLWNFHCQLIVSNWQNSQPGLEYTARMVCFQGVLVRWMAGFV